LNIVVIYKITANCPSIKNQVDLTQIRETLNDSPGFSSVDFNLEEHTLVIFSANQDEGRDVLHKLSHAGYPAVQYDIEALPDHVENSEASPHH
jgi:hypothetical protein